MATQDCEFVCRTDDREAWLGERVKGIGSSDCSAVLGENPWKSANMVWLEKCGLSAPDDLSNDQAVQWGTYLEEPIAKRYRDVTGHSFTDANGLFRSKKFPWMLASPDRLIRGTKRGVEIKNVGWRQGANWTPKGGELPDELCVPSYYRLQVAHQMCVLGIDVWDLCVLIGGQDFRIYELHRDPELEGIIVEHEYIFWKHVTNRTEPPPCADSQAYRDFLTKKLATHSGEMLQASSPEVIARLQALQFSRQYFADAKQRLIAAQNAVCEIIGTAKGIQFPDPKEGKVVWAGRNHKRWKDIAIEAGATPELIEKHTAMGPRELRAYGKFFKIEGEEENDD